MNEGVLAARRPATGARRCFRPDPRLLRLYGVLALPGGPAADLALGAPVGTARLLERLLYLRNGRTGRSLDRLGGKFGSSSSAEMTTVELTFADGDAPEAFALVERWLVEPPHPDDVADALRLVRAEAGGRRDLTAHVLGHALRSLTGGRHFAAITDPEHLEAGPANLADRQRQLLALGWATAAIGPGTAPWPEPEPEPGAAAFPGWCPASPATTMEPGRPLVEIGDGGSRSMLCVARGLPGLGERLDPGELAAAVIDYGRELEPQRRLDALLGPAKPAVHHRRYGEVGFLAVVVPGRPGREQRLADAAGEVFDALPDTPLDHARRRLIHHLELLIDTPRRRAAEEGLCTLYGAPSPMERLLHARSCPDEELWRALRRTAEAPAASVTARR